MELEVLALAFAVVSVNCSIELNHLQALLRNLALQAFAT
jgi:hypothetical protein